MTAAPQWLDVALAQLATQEGLQHRLLHGPGASPPRVPVVQLHLYGLGCPPCNSDCRQGRDCPARRDAKTMESTLPGSSTDAKA